MLNTRNQLDKIIITAMDRFVWFVLLVVISHLVTEFTRVTGYTRGPRQDMVTVNDSSIQPIRVQNLVLYPGQEYGHYEQQNQQYYNGNNPYNNYANNNNNNNNFFSRLFNPSSNNNNNKNNGQQQISGNNDDQNAQQGDVRTFSLQPIIDSIFEIPISTLRAVNNMVGRLTGSYQHQTQQQPPNQQLPQQQSPQYPSSFYYGGMQKSAAAATDTLQPKTEFEILKRVRQSTQAQQQTTAQAATAEVAPLRKSSQSGFQSIPIQSTASMKNSKKSLLKQQSV